MSRVRIALLAMLVLLLAGGSGLPEAALMTPAPPADEVRKPAPGMFLVASRSFQSPFFRGSVVYLVQHDEQTSLGVVVNHPGSARLADWLPDFEGTQLDSLPLYDGGPVYTGLVAILFESRDWQPEQEDGFARQVSGDVFASFDPAVLERLLQENTGSFERVRCYFGHVGWYAGQLEQEISAHYWHLVPGDPDEVFGEDAGSLWLRLIERLEPAEPWLPQPISMGLE